MALSKRYDALIDKYAAFEGENLLRAFIKEEFPEQIALVSSFGIEAALLLDMVAKIDPETPVIFLDTGKLFSETLQYRDLLIKHLGLKNVKTYYPDYIDLQRDDPHGDLWKKNTNACCYNRKVKPLNVALKGYKAWITGRKRVHGGLRTSLPMIELFEGRIKINPLAQFSMDQIKEEFVQRGLPRHPLQDQGYLSVGCAPCTSLPADQEDIRSGRWSGENKTECGIHLSSDGTFKRGAA